MFANKFVLFKYSVNLTFINWLNSLSVFLGFVKKSVIKLSDKKSIID